MGGVGRKLSFRARWALPLLAGPGITAAAMAALYLAAGDGGAGPPADGLFDPQREAGAEGKRRRTHQPRPRGAGRRDPLRHRRAVPTAAPLAPPADPETVFSRVIVVDGRRIRAVRDKKPVIVRVAGITVPAFKDTCTDPSGVVWKCGSKGRAELAG